MGLRTTSILIDDDILIDCGTGVGDLSLDEMRRLRHIFLTHSHLDHMVALPLLIDTLFDHLQEQPLTIHCEPETCELLKEHVFNWKIWPDFFRLPDGDRPVIRFCAVSPRDTRVMGGRQVEAVRVNHAVTALAYRIADGDSAMAFSGDTTTNDSLWEALNRHDRLDLLIVECAYANAERGLSLMAKHYCPSLLAEDLAKLAHRPKIGISHLKPGAEVAIFDELRSSLPDLDLCRLCGREVFEI
jgi:ribonuclease BN (tRNA processing enzyme)